MSSRSAARALALAIGLAAVGTIAAADEAPSTHTPAGAETSADTPDAESDPLVQAADELWQAYEDSRTIIEEQRSQLGSASGEDRALIEEKVWSAQLEGLEALRDLAANLNRQEQGGLDTREMRAKLEDIFGRDRRAFSEHFEWRHERLAVLRKQRDDAEPEQRAQLETRLTEEQSKYQIALEALRGHVEAKRGLGYDATSVQKLLIETATARAEEISGRLVIAQRQRAGLIDRRERNPQDASIEVLMQATEENVERQQKNLTATIALLKRLDQDASRYQEALIEATGEITTGIFDRKVAAGLLRTWLDELSRRITERGPAWVMQVLFALLTIAIFILIAALTRVLLGWLVRSRSMSKLLRDTLLHWASRAIVLVGVFMALHQVGVQIGALLAGLGIAGFIIGFALQDTLANFAAGAMILIYRPFDVGDIIEAGGVQGRVSTMSLVSTTILTFDNQTQIVPNSKIWGDVLCNVTAQNLRRIDLSFELAHGVDIEQVERVAAEITSQHPKIVEDPPPRIRLHDIGLDSLTFIVWPWVSREDYFEVRWDLVRAIKERFDADGIEFARTYRDVHIASDR